MTFLLIALLARNHESAMFAGAAKLADSGFLFLLLFCAIATHLPPTPIIPPTKVDFV